MEPYFLLHNQLPDSSFLFEIAGGVGRNVSLYNPPYPDGVKHCVRFRWFSSLGPWKAVFIERVRRNAEHERSEQLSAVHLWYNLASSFPCRVSSRTNEAATYVHCNENTSLVVKVKEKPTVESFSGSCCPLAVRQGILETTNLT